MLLNFVAKQIYQNVSQILKDFEQCGNNWILHVDKNEKDK